MNLLRKNYLIFIYLLLFFWPTVSSAEIKAPRGALEGIWEIFDENNEKYSRLSLIVSYQFAGIGHKTEVNPILAIGVVQWPGNNYWSEASSRISINDDGAIIMNFGKFAYCNCVPVIYHMKQTDNPNFLIGEWRYDKKNQKGKSQWKRRPQPKLDKVGYYSNINDNDGTRQIISVKPGNGNLKIPQTMTRGDLRLYIWGDGLVGGHNVWIDTEGGKFRIRESGWVCKDGSQRRWGDAWRKCGSRDTLGDGVAGIYLDLRFKQPLGAGIRTLWINGQPIKLNIFDPSMAKQKAVIQSIEILNAASLAPAMDVRPGDSIRVRITYDGKPEEKQTTVTIRTSLSGDEIRVAAKPTDDPAIFLSKPVRVKGVHFDTE